MIVLYIMNVLFALLFYSYLANAITSFAPPQSRVKNAVASQTRIACKPFVENTTMSSLAIDVIPTHWDPKYDVSEFLLSYGSIDVDSIVAIEDANIAHDTIVKMRCRGVTQAMYNGNIVKEYPGRCNNGYFHPCYPNGSRADSALEIFYVNYTGNQKNCLISPKESVIPCRPACDVTRFTDSTKYQITETLYDVSDVIGYNLDGTLAAIIYKQVLPKDGISVACGGGTFLSTSITGQEKSFTVSCNTDGYVTFPDDKSITETSLCTNEKACSIPVNSSDKSWGVYNDGNFVNVSFIPSRGYVNVRCGADSRNDERPIFCMNGNLLPSAKTACD